MKIWSRSETILSKKASKDGFLLKKQEQYLDLLNQEVQVQPVPRADETYHFIDSGNNEIVLQAEITLTASRAKLSLLGGMNAFKNLASIKSLSKQLLLAEKYSFIKSLQKNHAWNTSMSLINNFGNFARANVLDAGTANVLHCSQFNTMTPAMALLGLDINNIDNYPLWKESLINSGILNAASKDSIENVYFSPGNTPLNLKTAVSFMAYNIPHVAFTFDAQVYGEKLVYTYMVFTSQTQLENDVLLGSESGVMRLQRNTILLTKGQSLDPNSPNYNKDQHTAINKVCFPVGEHVPNTPFWPKTNNSPLFVKSLGVKNLQTIFNNKLYDSNVMYELSAQCNLTLQLVGENTDYMKYMSKNNKIDMMAPLTANNLNEESYHIITRTVPNFYFQLGDELFSLYGDSSVKIFLTDLVNAYVKISKLTRQSCQEVRPGWTMTSEDSLFHCSNAVLRQGLEVPKILEGLAVKGRLSNLKEGGVVTTHSSVVEKESLHTTESRPNVAGDEIGLMYKESPSLRADSIAAIYDVNGKCIDRSSQLMLSPSVQEAGCFSLAGLTKLSQEQVVRPYDIDNIPVVDRFVEVMEQVVKAGTVERNNSLKSSIDRFTETPTSD